MLLCDVDGRGSQIRINGELSKSSLCVSIFYSLFFLVFRCDWLLTELIRIKSMYFRYIWYGLRGRIVLACFVIINICFWRILLWLELPNRPLALLPLHLTRQEVLCRQNWTKKSNLFIRKFSPGIPVRRSFIRLFVRFSNPWGPFWSNIPNSASKKLSSVSASRSARLFFGYLGRTIMGLSRLIADSVLNSTVH